MNTKKAISRAAWLPFGLIKGLWQLGLIKSRDFENKRRFRYAIIDAGSSFSDDTTIGESSHILPGATINQSHIGSYTYVNFNALIQNAQVGNYCSISTNVNIGLGAHPLHLFSTSPLFYRKNNALQVQLVENNPAIIEYKPINIGSDVWIGANAIVMDGVNIGHGAVIAAGAVVTKDIPPYAIAGGIPATIIKYRFPQEICDALLTTKWWEKSPQEILLMKESLDSICNATSLKD